jgi:drug/metabolite transporter (DMT)-like permease
MILLNFLYWIISTVELLLMKILANNYVDDIIFNSFTRSIMLPYNTWKIYKMYKLKNRFNPRWFDILTGLCDQLDIYFCYIALNGLSIGEYITYRTFSIFMTGISLYILGKNILSFKKIASFILIFSACLILLIFNNNNKIKYIFACLFSSYLYSCICILIELNVKTKSDRKINYYWTKIISNIIGGIVGIMFENQNQLVSNILQLTNSLYVILIISLLIAICENFNYYLKVKIIALTQDKSGSIIIMFLDIFRRFTLLIIGSIFFHEYYNNIMFISISLMFLGSIIGLINFSQCIDKNSLSDSNIGTGNTDNTRTTIIENCDDVIDDDNIELIKDPINNI